MLKGTGNEKDNFGLWPMYIYNVGLECDEVKYVILFVQLKATMDESETVY